MTLIQKLQMAKVGEFEPLKKPMAFAIGF